jgi:hypothetical protein
LGDCAGNLDVERGLDVGLNWKWRAPLMRNARRNGYHLGSHDVEAGEIPIEIGKIVSAAKLYNADGLAGCLFEWSAPSGKL